MRTDRAQRIFWSRVSKPDEDGCWLWTGPLNEHGYGRQGVQRAHRVAYEALVGPIPEGLTLDHLCRVRSCVNPAHLEPVTRGENVRRGDHSHCGRWQRARTMCPKGHPYAGKNVYVSGGRRQCRYCVTHRNAWYVAHPASVPTFDEWWTR